MRIMILSALYPPHAFGGAEDCAQSFATWASQAGHDVRVVMAANEVAEAGRDLQGDGVSVHMIGTPHIYPVFQFPTAAGWKKPIWHAQDHFDPRASGAIVDAIERFAPEVIVIHYMQGFGYAVLKALARCGVPVVYVLHDLGLACIRMSMFRKGEDCGSQCLECRFSSQYKLSLVQKIAQQAPIGFISPSQANLDTLDRYFPVKAFPHATILNTKKYPEPKALRQDSSTLRLLFAGKLDAPKGIALLADAVASLAPSADIRLTIAGKGPLEEELARKYGGQPWFRPLGFVSHQVLADEMASADLMCVPSQWQENSPGVVIQALFSGLPVMASRRGGLPELVEDGVNGILVDGGRPEDWGDALRSILNEPGRLAAMREEAWRTRHRFDQDEIGRQTMAFLESIIKGGAGAMGAFDSVKDDFHSAPAR